jgi:tRNA(Ile)-lysidine synthase
VQRKVAAYIAQHNLISPGHTVVVAVSSGADSVALMHLLSRLGAEQGFSLVVAHVHHGLRAEADSEQRFVEELAAALGHPCYSSRVDVRGLAAQEGRTLEEAGREARYRYLQHLCRELGAQRIATAHHRQDQAETVLLHVLRGSGLRGLQGMLPRRGNLVRPLLDCTRAEIEDYLRAQGLRWCSDASNLDLRFLRNRVRHSLLPQLEREYNPALVEALAQLAELARADEQVLEEATAGVLEQALAEEDGGVLRLDLEVLRGAPLGLQRRAVLHCLTRLGGPQGWKMGDVEAALRLAAAPGSARQLHLPRGLRVEKDYTHLVFHRGLPPPRPYCHLLQVPGITRIPEAGLQVEARLQPPGAEGEADVRLDWHRLKQPLLVRSRRPGDRMRPLGLGGSKKLQDLFVDARIPARERDRVPVLEDAGRVCWVAGMRPDERVAVGPETTEILALAVRPLR